MRAGGIRRNRNIRVCIRRVVIKYIKLITIRISCVQYSIRSI
jgi:hypothetical protein